MKLHRLLVANFAAVRDLDVQFGPGLNVLYGPNDLGKSTLVEAIRLALLLPHASESCDPYVGWTGGRDPVVELTFETEPQRFWRVKKEFGKGGSSLLQESKNGQDFDDVERGRKVDGKLRELLRWGIPEPGGSGGRIKGVPSSFLATALLSTQSDVTAMLHESLESDPAASGKERIAAALQAVAQDPLFAALLKDVQARRDEAYTDKGLKKAAKGSVFKVAAERVKDTREEKERLQKTVSDSEGAEKQLLILNEDRLLQQEKVVVAQERVMVLERSAKQAADRAVAAEQVRLAEETVRRIRKLGADVEEAEQESRRLLLLEEEAKQEWTAAQKGKAEADAALKAAEENPRAEGSNPALNDDVVRRQLELTIAASEQTMGLAQQRIDAAAAAQELLDAATNAERECREQEAIAVHAQESSAQAAAKEQLANDELRRCDLIEKALDVLSSEKAVATASAAAQKHLALHAQMGATSEERAVLARRRAAIVVPAPGALVPMRMLANELAAARGALDVGFVVTVTPQRPINIAIKKDSEQDEAVSTDGSFELEAATKIELAIADLVSIQIRGGRRQAQERVRKLEERWNREVAPHLAAAVAADLPGLEAKLAEAQELDANIRTKDAEIDSLRTQANSVSGAASDLQQMSEQLQNCRTTLGDESMEKLSVAIDKLGSDPVIGLRKRRQQLTQAVDVARTIAGDAAKVASLAEGRSQSLQAQFESVTANRNLMLARFPEGVAAALAAGQSDLAKATAETQRRKAELASLDTTIALRRAQVEEAVAGARTSADAARLALEAAQVRLNEAMTARAAQIGRLAELRKQRDAEDLVSAENKFREASERHAALPVPELTVTNNDVSAAKAVEAGAISELNVLEAEIQRANGALAQVGGAVARERLRDAMEAFELAQQQDRETEADYEAWKLLLDQMKEADAAQASNLGLNLAPAIASRFQDLTARRYETVRLTASLGTEGVVVGGTLRSSERMSVGTREQLSTLYRLSLAEYLKSVLVLDDQLVQSDETRMDWFRALLKEKSQAFQIVVFTCRPRDYLEKNSMVLKGKAFHADTDDGFTRAIDLVRAFNPVRVKSV